MKKSKSFISIFLFMFLATCATAHAIQHEVGVSLNGEFMNLEYGDEDTYKLNAGYKFYFNSLENKNQPIDLLPFLLHPSNVYGILQKGQYDYEGDQSGYNSDKDWLGIKTGGMVYLPSNTGLGGYIRYHEGDWKDNDKYLVDSYSYDEKEVAFQFAQYLGDSTKLWFSLSRGMEKIDYDVGGDDDIITDWFKFGCTGAYGTTDRFVVAVKSGIGRQEYDYFGHDTDWRLYNLGVSLGPAVRNFAIYFTVDYTNSDLKDSSTNIDELEFGIKPRIWFNDHFLLGFELLYTREVDDFDDSGWVLGTTFAARF